MSDSQKADLALTLLVESCTAASAGLAEEASEISNYPTSDFLTLRTDFLSILSIIYAATTKTALSLKPSAPHPKASLVPLKDLTNNVGAIVHCTHFMSPKEGITMVAEYRKVAHGVIDAVRSFGLALQASSAAGAASAEQYLIRAGEVHELIDTAKRTGGLSLNNCDAVHRLFSRNHDSLTDASEEAQEMCKAVSSDDCDTEEDSFDDGWEELGVSSTQNLSPTERTVTEKTCALVKLGLLLHKRIMKDVLSSQSQTTTNDSLDTLATFSAKLVVVFDDLISSLYAPQDASNIQTYLGHFKATIQDCRATIFPQRTKSLEEAMNALTLSHQNGDKTKMWFTTCFNQIDKALHAVADALKDL